MAHPGKIVAGFTTVPLKALSDQVWIKYQYLLLENSFFSIVVSLQKWLAHFYIAEKHKGNIKI